MDTVTTWHISVYLDEHERQTRARAELHTDAQTLTGHGLARCRPSEQDVPEIGDELATARALSDLSHQLLHLAVRDLEDATQARVTLYE